MAERTFFNKKESNQTNARRSPAWTPGADAAVISSVNTSKIQRLYQKTWLKGLAGRYNNSIPPTRNPPRLKCHSLPFVYSLPCYFPCLDFNHYTAANPFQFLLHSVINVHNCPFPLHLYSQQLHFCLDTTCNHHLKRTHLQKQRLST